MIVYFFSSVLIQQHDPFPQLRRVDHSQTRFHLGFKINIPGQSASTTKLFPGLATYYRMELGWTVFSSQNHGQFVQQFRIVFPHLSHQLPQSERPNSW